MRLRLNLVVIVLALNCWINVNSIDDDRSMEKKLNRLENYKLPISKPILTRRRIVGVGKVTRKPILKPGKNSQQSPQKYGKPSIPKTAVAVAKAPELRERPRKNKKKMNRALMALLMAYKLKFAALIPTLIGGLVLLLGTTALAGFFFALFAAILGLRGH